MNKELFDFASHMYAEFAKIDDALSSIGYYNDNNALADELYAAVWDALEVDSLLKKEDTEIEIVGVHYPYQKWYIDSGEERISDDDFAEKLIAVLQINDREELNKIWDFCVKAHANNE